jgi:hypothetical protein
VSCTDEDGRPDFAGFAAALRAEAILLEGGTLEAEADDQDLGGDGGGASSLGAVGPPTVATHPSPKEDPT